MQRIDKQGRITIPFEIRSETCLKPTSEIAICYDSVTKRYYLKSSNLVWSDEKLLAIRKLDAKYRMYIPKDFRQEKFLVYLQNGIVFLDPNV